jgi:DNA-binding NarL/FixJ family response regulator
MRADSIQSVKQDMICLCHSALDSRTLRLELLKRLRKVVPFEYVYFSTTDPATHLLTNSVLLEEPPAWMMSVFLQNEFLQTDFNKFGDMFKTQQAVALLSQATGQAQNRSPRYRDMLRPLAMEDELRAVFVTEAACWGTLCLHREQSALKYTTAEADFVAQLAPHIADGLRKAVLLEQVTPAETPDGPGVLLLNDDLAVLSITGAAAFWISELSTTEQHHQPGLPLAVRSVVAALKAIEGGMTQSAKPKVRIHTRSGHWLTIYASRLTGSDAAGQITVIFAIAQPMEIAPVIMQTYLLTKREGEITQCILQGWSTREIAAKLHISSNTVQDHLKAIFEKVDVRSRGELTARIFARHY